MPQNRDQVLPGIGPAAPDVCALHTGLQLPSLVQPYPPPGLHSSGLSRRVSHLKPQLGRAVVGVASQALTSPLREASCPELCQRGLELGPVQRPCRLVACPCSKGTHVLAQLTTRIGSPGRGSSRGALTSSLCPGIGGAAQLVSCADVYVLDLYEEVRMGVLVRWLFRLILFRVLVGFWRIVRRR